MAVATAVATAAVPGIYLGPSQRTQSRRTQGASSHNFALAILRLYGSKAKATSTGAMPATLTQVMTGRIDIGFAVPPIGFKSLMNF